MTALFVFAMASYRDGSSLREFGQQSNSLPTVGAVQHFIVITSGEYAPCRRVVGVVGVNPVK